MVESNPLPIGIFDSGVGGISVANAIKSTMPAENLIYVADSAYAPYGNKSSEFILDRAKHIVEFLLTYKVKLIVVACNTATLSCIETLRAQYPIPFVGVEPGVKPAVAATKSGKVGVLATTLTVQSLRYHKLIERVAGEVEVLSQGCDGLADQIEKGDFNSHTINALLAKYVEPLLSQGADHIALGCTHYGFVSETLKTILKKRASLIDTDQAVARQTQTVLNNLHGTNRDSRVGNIIAYTSDPDVQAKQNMALFWRHPVQDVLTLPIR